MIGRRSKRGSSGASSPHLLPYARHSRARRPRSFAIFIRCCALLHCRNKRQSQRREPMNHDLELSKTRRKFLRMLAASPVFAGSHLLSNSLRNLLAAGEMTEGKVFRLFENFQPNDDVIKSPDHALQLMDFEA